MDTRHVEEEQSAKRVKWPVLGSAKRTGLLVVVVPMLLLACYVRMVSFDRPVDARIAVKRLAAAGVMDLSAASRVHDLSERFTENTRYAGRVNTTGPPVP